MLKVLLLFIILIAGIVLGPLFAAHQGYVLIQTDNYNIETSVTSLVIMLVLLFVVLFALEWLLRRLLRTGARTRGWFIGRKRSRARRQTHEGLIKLAEGDYGQVEKLLARNADHADQPLVNYLLAAEAAQQRGDELRANQYLARAAEVAGSDQLPVDITRVRLQLVRNENHAARHGVDALLNYAPRHPEVLRLAEQAYLRTDAFEPLLEILPALAKQGLRSDDEIEKLQIRAYIGLMDQAMANGGSEGLKQWWKTQGRKTRHETTLQVVLAEHLIECDDHPAAQQVVIDGLKRRFDERLVRLMPHLKSGNPEPLEKLLQQQIRQHGASALLNSTLGQLLMRHGEWQSAADALRAALKQRPDAYDYAWLADTLDKLHRPEEAAQMRRDGLLLTLHQEPSP